MASFTAKDVQALRESTGCGMMDCKKALTESDGNIEKATELLREKGLAAAAKKAGRIAAEGIVSAYVDKEAKIGVIVEVNSETDFVAKNADFIEFVNACAVTVANNNPQTVEELLKMQLFGKDITVEEALREKILVIGENMNVRRFVRYEGDVVAYIHGGGRIGVLVKFEGDAKVLADSAFEEVKKDVAMQIAALAPLYLDAENVPAEVVDKEKEILIAQIKNDPKHAGKPDNILEKMVTGRIDKFYTNSTLNAQVFVKDNALTVKKYVDGKASELGGAAKIKEFARFEKGEGLAKRDDDFASEVANMVK